MFPQEYNGHVLIWAVGMFVTAYLVYFHAKRYNNDINPFSTFLVGFWPVFLVVFALMFVVGFVLSILFRIIDMPVEWIIARISREV